MRALQADHYYSYQEAAYALDLSLAWVKKHVGGAIKRGLILNLGDNYEPRVRASDLMAVVTRRLRELMDRHPDSLFQRKSEVK